MSLDELLAAATRKVGGQGQLAAVTGLDQAALSRIKTHKAKASPETVVLLCAVLGLPPSQARITLARIVAEEAKQPHLQVLMHQTLLDDVEPVPAGARLPAEALSRPGRKQQSAQQAELDLSSRTSADDPTDAKQPANA